MATLSEEAIIKTNLRQKELYTTYFHKGLYDVQGCKQEFKIVCLPCKYGCKSIKCVQSILSRHMMFV